MNITKESLCAALIKAFQIQSDEFGDLFRPVNKEEFPESTSYFIDGCPDLMDIAQWAIGVLDGSLKP